jgi:hypothetical protein
VKRTSAVVQDLDVDRLSEWGLVRSVDAATVCTSCWARLYRQSRADRSPRSEPRSLKRREVAVVGRLEKIALVAGSDKEGESARTT